MISRLFDNQKCALDKSTQGVIHIFKKNKPTQDCFLGISHQVLFQPIVASSCSSPKKQVLRVTYVYNAKFCFSLVGDLLLGWVVLFEKWYLYST